MNWVARNYSIVNLAPGHLASFLQMLQVLLASEQIHTFCIGQQVSVISSDEVIERLGGPPPNIHRCRSFRGEQRLADSFGAEREAQMPERN